MTINCPGELLFRPTGCSVGEDNGNDDNDDEDCGDGDVGDDVMGVLLVVMAWISSFKEEHEKTRLGGGRNKSADPNGSGRRIIPPPLPSLSLSLFFESFAFDDEDGH